MTMQISKPTLFYVDDDADDLDFFREIALDLSVVPELFSDPKEFLEALKKRAKLPQIIFSDLNMPRMNGFELISEIRKDETFGEIPIVVLSTSADRDGIQRCYDAGANLYMIKSSSFDKFRKSLERVLGIDWETFEKNVRNFLLK
ncbi:MAG: response regulator [Chitinophagaceae bacterium]|nr:MAG: response regulator [Chitinophagaceae bacterium]